MKPPVKSKRRKIGSARFEVQMDVQFLGVTPEGTEIDGRGIVRNLSMRGALMETCALVKTDDHLTMFLAIPNQAELLDRHTSRKLMRYLSGIHNAARAQRKAG